MLSKGAHVPDFALPCAFADGRKTPVQLKEALAKGPVVLSFFPLAFTRVCTTQMCDTRDHHGALDALQAQVYGFSCDSVFTNVHFAKEQGLAHGIFSDANREVALKIWATEDVAGVKNVPKRGWMLIAQDGTVTDAWTANAPGDAWPGTAPIVAAIERLRSA